jgi:hypothetical protein
VGAGFGAGQEGGADTHRVGPGRNQFGDSIRVADAAQNVSASRYAGHDQAAPRVRIK